MDEPGESGSANCAVRNIQRYIIWYKQCRNVNAASALIRLLLKQLNARDYWHCLLMNQIIYINYIVFYGVWYYINNALWCTVHVSWELSWQMFASIADWDFSVNLGEVGVCSASQSDIRVQGCFKGNCITTQDTGQLLIVFMLFFFYPLQHQPVGESPHSTDYIGKHISLYPFWPSVWPCLRFY